MSSFAPPSGCAFLATYDISFDGSYSGDIYIILPYDPSTSPEIVNKLKLFHWNNNTWEDCTTYIDTENHTISGRVTSLSPFGIGYFLSGGGGGGYTTGANENMIALIAILAISSGVFLIRKRRFN